MDSQTPAADGRLLSCLALMVREGASDLFLLAGAPPTLKRQGAFLPITKGSVTAEDVRTMVYSIMRKAQIDEFVASKECDFSFQSQDLSRYRVNVHLQRGNVGGGRPPCHGQDS